MKSVPTFFFKKIFLLFLVILFILATGQEILSQKTKIDKGDLNQKYITIQKLLGRKEFDKVIVECKKIIEQEHTFYKAFFPLIRASIESDKLDKITGYFQGLISENPNNLYFYYGLGVCYQKQKEYSKAIEYYKKSIELKAEFVEAYVDLIECYDYEKNLTKAEKYFEEKIHIDPNNPYLLFGLGYISDLQNKVNQGIEYYNRALTIFREIGDKKSEGDCLNNIGVAYYFTGSLHKALEYWKEDLKIAKEIEEVASELFCLQNIGVVYYELDDYPMSLEFTEKALKIAKEIGNTFIEGRCLMIIGNIHNEIGSYKKALECYKQTLRIARKNEEKVDEGGSLGNIALINWNLGRYTQALESYKEALELIKEVGDKRTEIKLIHNIGQLYQKLGNYDKALQYCKKVVETAQEIGAKREEAISQNSIGNIYMYLGDYNQSLKLCEQALKIFREMGDKKEEASCLGDISLIHKRLGNYSKALEYLDQGLKIARKIGNKFLEAQNLIDIGRINHKLDNYSKSKEIFSKVLSIGQEIRHPEIVWHAYYGLASNCEIQKEFDQALDHYKKAIAMIENIRTQLQLEEYKSGFIKGKIEIHENLINLLFRLHQKDTSKGYDKECFYYVEKAKARAFLDSLGEAGIDVKAHVSSEIREKERKISREISKIQTNLQKSGLSEEKRNELYNKLEKAEDEYNSLIIKIKRENPKYANLIYPEPYNLEQVQEKLLDGKTALIEYLIGDKYAFGFLVTKNDLFISSFHKETTDITLDNQTESMPETESLINMAESYIHTLTLEESKEFKGIDASKELYELLFAPFKDKLSKDIEKLIIIPDRNLYYLPFGTLISSTVPGQLTEEHRRYLIEDYKISYAPSASSLINLLQRGFTRKREKDLLAIGDPVFHLEKIDKTKPTSSELAKPVKADQIMRGDYFRKGYSFSPLIYTSAEIKSTSKFFKNKLKELFLKERASEENIKKMELNKFKIIHIATHGLLDNENGKRSALVLTLDEDPTEDGFLQAREIYNLKFNADLVILSACQTGKGKLEKGEGVTGLSDAFFYAGAKSVLATLWNINDKSTALFMSYFYKYLSQGKSKARALQEAKFKMINSKYNHPFYWASFVLIGDYGSSINISKPSFWERLF